MLLSETEVRNLRPLAFLALAIAVAGFVGGAVAYIAEVLVGPSTAFEWRRFMLQACVGGPAALFGVFLLANSDTSSATATIRACVFAIACGVSWQPIYSATRSLVGQQIAKDDATELIAQAADAVQGVSKATSATEKAAVIESSLQNATEGLSTLRRLPGSASDDSGREAAAQLLESLRKEHEATPETFQDPRLRNHALKFQAEVSRAYPDLGATTGDFARHLRDNTG